MDRPLKAVRQQALEWLLPKLDHRMGNVLFVGAHLPEVALHVLKSNLFVTVVENDAARLEEFFKPLREAKLDRGVSVDQRKYETIDFVTSSYNVILVWEGIPDGMVPNLFFKKARRELKAGSMLYLRESMRPELAPESSLLGRLESKLPDHLKGTVGSLARQIESAAAPAGAKEMAELKEAAEQYLALEEIVPLSIFTERLAHLPPGVRKFLRIAPLPTLEVAKFLDSKLLSTKAGHNLASSAILSFSKSLEFGKVFRV